MKSQLILHNQVSLNGAFTGFDVDMGKYYELLNAFKPNYILIGSETARSGIENYYEEIPAESPDDFRRPSIESSDQRPYWVVPDSSGKLMGVLHTYRNAGYCKDIIVLISRSTPQTYKQYLHERNYDFFSEGYNKVDLESCIGKLEKKYGAGIIVTDAGRKLAKKLFDLHLFNQISLIISPLLTGKKHEPLLHNLNLNSNIDLELESVIELGSGLIHLKYKIIR